MSALLDAADALLRAERERDPIAPLTATIDGLTIDDAYEIQLAGRRLRLDGERRLVGRKVGLTSKVMQEALGVDQPDFGYLLDDMLIAPGATVSFERFVQPRVEAEIAFKLARPLEGAELTVEDVLAATEAVAPALEIIDSRIADWRIAIEDTIADNASGGAAVIGAWVPLADVDGDLASLELTMEAGGETVSGRGDAVLGHPAAPIVWLAASLARYGERIEAGEVVIPGSVARALPLVRGGGAHASCPQLGAVEVSFA